MGRVREHIEIPGPCHTHGLDLLSEAVTVWKPPPRLSGQHGVRHTAAGRAGPLGCPQPRSPPSPFAPEKHPCHDSAESSRIPPRRRPRLSFPVRDASASAGPEPAIPVREPACPSLPISLAFLESRIHSRSLADIWRRTTVVTLTEKRLRGASRPTRM